MVNNNKHTNTSLRLYQSA